MDFLPKLGRPPKFVDFVKSNNRFDILEGTTYSGKTTVGFSVKLMLEIALSKKRSHFIAGKDLGTLEKNILNAEAGVLQEWGDYVEYRGNGTSQISMPHIKFFQTSYDDYKIIYCLGYDDKARWQKVLGGQVGCGGVDEANIADIEFIRESSIRCDYKLWTLNPDDPELPIYKEYINHSRPLEKYINEYPPELLAELNLPERAGYRHWYFTFEDNKFCTPEKKQQIYEDSPVGTKQYKNKVLGIRGVGQGVLYDPLLTDVELVPETSLNPQNIEELVATVDVGSSVNGAEFDKSHTIITLGGYSKDYHRVIALASKKIESIEDLDIVKEGEDWLYKYWLKYYGKVQAILIDSADWKLVSTWQHHSRWGGKIAVRGCVKNHNVLCPDLARRAAVKCQLMMRSPQYPLSRIVWCDKAMLHAHRQLLQDKNSAELDTGNIYMDYADCFSYLILWRIAKLMGVEKQPLRHKISIY